MRTGLILLTIMGSSLTLAQEAVGPLELPLPHNVRRIGGRQPDYASTKRRVNRINRMLEELKQISAKKQERPIEKGTRIEDPVSLPLKTLEVSVPTPPRASSDSHVTVEPIAKEPRIRPLALSATVDSLALANNLYAQGRIEEAKPIFVKLAAQTRSASELAWIQYQLACCHRLDGEMQEAIRLYRIVSGSREERYWASRAQWWLKYLSRSEQLEQRRTKLKESLSGLTEEIERLRQGT